MTYKLIINTQECVSRFEPRYEAAQRFVDSEVLRDSAPFVPMRTGYLMKSGNTGTVLGSGQVSYNAPYARRCYYGHCNFSTEKHPQATSQWFEKAKAIKKDTWVKGAQAIIRGEANA